MSVERGNSSKRSPKKCLGKSLSRSFSSFKESDLRGLHSFFKSSKSRKPQVPIYEEKASITIQTAARRLLARSKITKLRLKKDYQVYIADKREAKVRQDAEMQIMQDRIDAKKRRTQVELKAMRKTFEEKTASFLRDDIRLEVEEKLRLEVEEKLRLEVEEKLRLGVEESEASHYDIDNEFVFALQEEQRQLLAEMEEQALLDEAMREANVKLEMANIDVTKMFESINDFSTRKTVSIIKLSRAESKLAEEVLPKIQRYMGRSIIKAEIEKRQIEVYKRCMQKVLDGVHWAEWYDQPLDDFVVESITAAETQAVSEKSNLVEMV
jgi:hypothetical protein